MFGIFRTSGILEFLGIFGIEKNSNCWNLITSEILKISRIFRISEFEEFFEL